MSAGRRTAWLEIYATTESEGTAGDVRRGWAATPEFSIYARKRTLSAAETTVAASRGSAEDVVFEALWLDGITVEHRIKHGGEWYDITAIRDPGNGLRRDMHIYASSGRRYGA